MMWAQRELAGADQMPHVPVLIPTSTCSATGPCAQSDVDYAILGCEAVKANAPPQSSFPFQQKQQESIQIVY